MIYFIVFFIIIALHKVNPILLDKNYSCNFKFFGKKEMTITVNNKKMLFIISFLLLFLIGALRENVGTDYAIYRDYHIPKVLEGNLSHIEPLSTLLFIIGGAIGGHQMIFILMHILIIVFVVKAIYDQSNDYALSFYLFFSVGFFNMSLNLMRQSIAIAIFLYAIKYIGQKKWINYFSLILVAILFHKTALIYIPIYFFNRLTFSLKKLFIIVTSFVLVSSFFDNILNFLTLQLGIYRNYWGQTEMSSRIVHNFSLSYWSINLFVFIVMIVLFQLGRKDISMDVSKLSLYLYIQLLSLLIMYAAWVTYVPNFDRILTMFSYVQIISLPSFFSLDVDKKVKKILLYSTMIILMIGFLILFVIKNIGETFPYTVIFN